MKVLRTAIAFFAAGLSLTLAPPCFADNLGEELVGVLKDHPKIRQSEKGVESAGEGIIKSLSDFYPQVEVSGDAGLERISTPSNRDGGTGGYPWSRSRNVSGLTITQNLFNGFSTVSSVRTSQLNKQVAEFSLEGTRQGILFEAIGAYINVLRQKRLIELARNNQDNIQEQLSLEDERVSRGSGVAVDVLQAKSRLQIAKERRVGFEGALADAVSTYTQVFNHAPDLEAMIDPIPPVEILPTDLEKAIEIALNENPAINNSSSTVDVADERKSSIKSEYYPSVDLVGSANYEKHKNATLGTRRDYSILLQASWDLFTGFSTQASQSQAAWDHKASLDNLDYVMRKVVEQVKIGWQALLTARERLELLENAVNIASEVFESRQKLREAGKETVINVLDAENEIHNAQINYTAASYDERLAVFQLLMAMGRLTAANLNMPVN